MFRLFCRRFVGRLSSWRFAPKRFMVRLPYSESIAIRQLAAISFAAMLLACSTPAAVAQKASANPGASPADEPRKAVAKARKTTAQGANIASGAISTIEAQGDTLTIEERTGKKRAFVLTGRTRFTKAKRAADKGDFKAGDTVIVHYRRSRSDDSLIASDVADAASWSWLTEVRKNTTEAVVVEITDDTLSVTVKPEKTPLEYAVSEKTMWRKAGKEAEAGAFKPGDRVYVVPRSLPSGKIMARAVSDSAAGAAQEKERTAASVRGVLLSVDPAAHRLSMKTAAGDTRSLAYSDETELLQSGKTLPLTKLKPGLAISARLRHEAGDDVVVWRVTIEAARKSAPVKRRPSTKKGDGKAM